jgi:dTDP-4-amino-4,6-dideoxygalactose transaminase
MSRMRTEHTASPPAIRVDDRIGRDRSVGGPSLPDAGDLLRRTLRPHQHAVVAAVERVLASGTFILGPECRALEGDLARYLGARHAVVVASGTAALALALAASGVRPGDAVLTPSLTASAGGAAIRSIGADPVFVDVEASRLTIDPVETRRALRRRPDRCIAAIVAVHLHGQPVAIEELRAVADEAGVALIEDCCQAIGAKVDGVACGRWGDAAALSFYPTKNLGGIGDAGAVVTDDADMASRVRAMREYGWTERQWSAGWGVNARLDEVQAAALRVLLPHVDALNARRTSIADSYDRLLEAADVALPPRVEGAASVHHQYAVRTPARDPLVAWLRARGLAVTAHPPYGLHEQPAYRGADDAPLSRTSQALREMISLPMSAALTDAEVTAIASLVAEGARLVADSARGPASHDGQPG